jgi:hypothetical protein
MSSPQIEELKEVYRERTDKYKIIKQRLKKIKKDRDTDQKEIDDLINLCQEILISCDQSNQILKELGYDRRLPNSKN